LLRFSATLGVKDVEIQAVLLEDARPPPDLGDRGVPSAALSDRQLELVLCVRRRLDADLKSQSGETKKISNGFHSFS
jgi:hypothetical protein